MTGQSVSGLVITALVALGLVLIFCLTPESPTSVGGEGGDASAARERQSLPVPDGKSQTSRSSDNKNEHLLYNSATGRHDNDQGVVAEKPAESDEILEVGAYRDPESDFLGADSEPVIHVGEFLDPDDMSSVDDSSEIVAVGKAMDPETLLTEDADYEVEHVGSLLQSGERVDGESETIVDAGQYIDPSSTP